MRLSARKRALKPPQARPQTERAHRTRKPARAPLVAACVVAILSGCGSDSGRSASGGSPGDTLISIAGLQVPAPPATYPRPTEPHAPPAWRPSLPVPDAINGGRPPRPVPGLVTTGN